MLRLSGLATVPARGRRLILVLTLASSALAAGLGATVDAAAATLPPTLTGEGLGAPPTVTASCNPAGTSTITFDVTNGVATGPYPGTFTAHGTVTLGPAITLASGTSYQPVLGFQESFTITSATGNVTGSKTLGAAVGTTSSCLTIVGDLNTGRFTANYTATITSAGSQYSDAGSSRVSINHLTGVGASTTSFDESFTSSLAQVTLIPPVISGCDSKGESSGDDQCPQDDRIHLGRTDGEGGEGQSWD